MRVCALLLAALGCVWATDPEQLALALKAQSDFDRVELAPMPQLADAQKCVMSQAAIGAVSPPEELALIDFRKGYCRLAAATVTGANRDYLAAAADLDRAIEAWPSRMLRKSARKLPPEPVSSGLRALAWIARLHAWTDDSVRAAAQKEIAAAIAAPSCTSNLMPAAQCEQLVETGRQWLGWIALREGNVDAAGAKLAGAKDSGWPEWIQGRREFDRGQYASAVTQFRSAVDRWRVLWQDPGPALARRLGPRPDTAEALADLGGAQLLAGDPKGAIASLDASLRIDPSNAYAFYRRARAHELTGQADLAASDYNLAARTAFANARELASGEAHLYRGILMYRRKDYGRAEDEFASALNFQIPQTMRADAQAWRHLAAVAAGSCASAREFLDRTLPGVSPYFPKEEARQAAANCATSANLNRQR